MLDATALDKIVQGTLETIEQSKEKIFSITEDARLEVSSVQKDLQAIQKETLEVIENVDALERQERSARVRLMEVSRDLYRFSEQDIRQAYEQAQALQVSLAVYRERELQLRTRRDTLERRLRTLQSMVERAEALIGQIGVILDFLGNNLQIVGAKLEEAQQQEQLALQIVLAQEKERRRVAREIHDGPAQTMAGMVMQAELCEKLLIQSPERARQELGELKNTVRLTLKDVRKIIYDLRPMALEDSSLYDALRRYTADFQEKTNLQITLRFRGEEQALGTAYKVALFRMVQEALSNVHKHARATTVTVQMEMLPQGVAVSVTDDGCGFIYEEMQGMSADHFGIAGMQERVALLKGTLNIRTGTGKGTTLLIRIPLNMEVADDETKRHRSHSDR
ncbi:sensor histidine kinase [Heliophilum fasciatum]|uniref:histidine kinase n=1 Tax=Heliophilum fasciatum TaxID=35700 RepID=A0A4R2RM72_9FIRM|nr:sensor histidine kinase [Heliophilum fasciatum]MCW2278830.1 two-component system sensor histidine kinase DegS [Heliophilum fasciatum]TCP64084.1 two-component system sensor histidine kinase DegS [Heliophilum fasciatum]